MCYLMAPIVSNFRLNVEQVNESLRYDSDVSSLTIFFSLYFPLNVLCFNKSENSVIQ